MARLMELFVIVNAACGIAAFLIARNMIARAKRKLGLDDAALRREDELEDERRRLEATHGP